MDPETRALVCHIFAEITARFETAAALSADGQGAGRRVRRNLNLIADLEATLADTGALVGAIRTLLAHHEAPRPASTRGHRKKSPEQ